MKGKDIINIASGGIRCLYAASNQPSPYQEGWHGGKAYAYLYALHKINGRFVNQIHAGGRAARGFTKQGQVLWKKPYKLTAGGEKDAFIISWVFDNELWVQVMSDIENEFGKQLRKDIEKKVYYGKQKIVK